MGCRHGFRRVLFGVAVLAMCQGPARAQYATNFDALTNGASILGSLTGSGQWMGAAGATAGVSTGAYAYAGATYSNCVVFQGEISNAFACITPDSTNHVATAQLLVQATWVSAMPDNSLCPRRQGGVFVSNGDVYAWSTNVWLRMINTNGTTQVIDSNAWTRFVFVANYIGDGSGGATTSVYYKVFVNGTNFVATNSWQRYQHGSPFAQDPNGTYIKSSATFGSGTAGISGFYLSGGGAVDELSAYPGAPVSGSPGMPTSSGIDVRAYQGADGVYVEYVAYDTEDDGNITLRLLDAQGNDVWSGTTNVMGGVRTFVCRFKVPGLTLGGSYNFLVTDEAHKNWSAYGVTVMPFAADMVQMSPVGVTVSFNCMPGRDYEIQWAEHLGDDWQPLTNLTAAGSHTNVFVFYPEPKTTSGFLRILLK